MIDAQTIEKIKDAARVEDVVGDFVDLKRRGANLLGLCPFHDEKSPSFTVSPAKGLFKCFGCGAGGDSVSFVMQHEKYSYPEALKYLAKKYNIEVKENEERHDAEYTEEQLRREALFNINAFAAKYFHEQLLHSDEGRSIGLSYFTERGFTAETVATYQLGYSPEDWQGLLNAAKGAGYTEQQLTDAGLVTVSEAGKIFDRFRARVMFPIYTSTGRVVGFGGRTLRNDKKTAKYVNSPETEIYHKSAILYGLHLAKKAIRMQDTCYLVEGYADTLAIYQAGVENVVASSGTSLTDGQIRLLKRFTHNVVLLYDGDAAGIKAALRGVDMLLAEGLNVKILPFANGHDPDSYIKAEGAYAFKKLLESGPQDFILFKTQVLLAEAGNDPIKKAEAIRAVVESIALIQDGIKAEVFVKECSRLLQMEERTLLAELNKIRLNKTRKTQAGYGALPPAADEIPAENNVQPIPDAIANTEEQAEKEVARLLMMYGREIINTGPETMEDCATFILRSVHNMQIINESAREVLLQYAAEMDNGFYPDVSWYAKSDNAEVARLAVDVAVEKYTLSKNWWEVHKINVAEEKDHLKRTVQNGLLHLNRIKVRKLLRDAEAELAKCTTDAEMDAILQKLKQLKQAERSIGTGLGSVIIK